MTKFPIVEKVCTSCDRTVYGKDVTECPVCGVTLIEIAT